jgi:hypothetical protein
MCVCIVVSHINAPILYLSQTIYTGTITWTCQDRTHGLGVAHPCDDSQPLSGQRTRSNLLDRSRPHRWPWHHDKASPMALASRQGRWPWHLAKASSVALAPQTLVNIRHILENTLSPSAEACASEAYSDVECPVCLD